MPDAHEASGIRPVRPGGWRALLFLSMIYILSWVDRMILSALGEPIKRDLALTDAQLGILGGFAFALTYSVLGLPAAAISERINRRTVITVALLIWSVMTAMSSMATGFLMLLFLRAGVGLGEAGLTAPAHSIIADFFPRERRTVAISLFVAAIPLGSLIAAVGGGYLVETFSWRVAFAVVGLPGILLAPLFYKWVREPGRGEADGVIAEERYSLLQVARTLLGTRSGAMTVISTSLAAMSSYSILAFAVSYLMRWHGLQPGQASTIFGLCVGAGQLVAMIVGGLFVERLGRFDLRWLLAAPAISMTLMAGMQAIIWAQPFALFVPLFTLTAMFGAVYMSPTSAVVHGLLPARMRAGGMALVLLCNAMVGLGFGPPLVGLISDHLAEAAFAGNYSASCQVAGSAVSATCASATAIGIERALTFSSVIALASAAFMAIGAVSLGRDLKASATHPYANG